MNYMELLLSIRRHPENQKYIQVKNMTLNTDKLQSLGFACEMSFSQGLQTLCDVIE